MVVKPRHVLLLIVISMLAACAPTSPTETSRAVRAVPTALPSATLIRTATASPTANPTFTLTPAPTASPAATLVPIPAPSPTPDPYVGLAIADLAARQYGGGALQIRKTLGATGAFTRTLITFPSDGLTIYGFMNVPREKGPFPVVIVLHGYIDPALYNTLDYTTHYADALAAAGYIVIHPNLRNYRPSDNGPDRFRVGMAVDVLNLVAILRQQAGQPGPLEDADPNVVGLWGHSMGGGIALKILTVSSDIKAAVLYGAMSGNEKLNFERIQIWSGGARGREELSTPPEALERISPIYYLGRIKGAVSIHHGERDGTVPLEWSLDLCTRLRDLGKNPECFTYPGQPHTFQGAGEALLIQRMIAFFGRLLKGE